MLAMVKELLGDEVTEHVYMSKNIFLGRRYQQSPENNKLLKKFMANVARGQRLKTKPTLLPKDTPSLETFHLAPGAIDLGSWTIHGSKEQDADEVEPGMVTAKPQAAKQSPDVSPAANKQPKAGKKGQKKAKQPALPENPHYPGGRPPVVDNPTPSGSSKEHEEAEAALVTVFEGVSSDMKKRLGPAEKLLNLIEGALGKDKCPSIPPQNLLIERAVTAVVEVRQRLTREEDGVWLGRYSVEAVKARMAVWNMSEDIAEKILMLENKASRMEGKRLWLMGTRCAGMMDAMCSHRGTKEAVITTPP
jgi:hypothetical protein